MRATNTLTALFLSPLLAQPALAAKQSIMGINMGSPTVEMLLGSLLAIAVLYSVYKTVKEGKGGSTALVIMAMVIAAWQNGGFNSVEKALNIMIAVALVQAWFDMKDEKTTVHGSVIRMVFGYILVKMVAVEGVDSMTAIMITVVAYSATNIGMQLLNRKETWDTLFHLHQKKFGGGLTSDGKIAEDDARNLWDRFLGKKADSGGGASADEDYKYSAKKIADGLRDVAKRIKPQGI